MPPTETRFQKEEHSLVLKASKNTREPGSSVNLTLSTGRGERYGRGCARRSNPTDPRRNSVGHSGLAIVKVANQMLGAWRCMWSCQSAFAIKQRQVTWTCSTSRVKFSGSLEFSGGWFESKLSPFR
jgi:hypothetical protein